MSRTATKAKPPLTGAVGPLAARLHLPPWLPPVLLVLLTILAYQPVWRAGFIWDDDVMLTNNPLVKAADGLRHIWFGSRSPDYLPLTSTSFWLEWRLWGTNPTGYHITNVLLHAVSALLVWRVLRRVGVPGAWLAGAIFALHPVNVESVAWITQRKNTLAMPFYLLSLLCFLRYDGTSRPSDNAQSRWYWLALTAFVLALLSKTAVAPLPLVILGLAWWQRGKLERSDVWRSVPFFAAALILGLITVWFQRNVTASEIVREDSFWSRVAVAGWAVWFYLFKALLPLGLMPVYPLWKVDPARALSYLPGLLLLAGIFLCWYYRRTWGKGWFFCVCYFVVMLLPVLGFENIAFMKASLVADHWQYFAIIGPIALVAAGLATGLGLPWKRPAWAPAGAGGVVVLGLGLLTWRLSAIYASPEAFWQAAVAGNPDYATAQSNLGAARLERGKIKEALPHLEKALELQPGDARAHNNLGNAMRLMGREDEAITHLRKALEIQPNLAEGHVNLGTVLLKKGQPQAALSHYRKAMELDPNLAAARVGVANLFRQAGDLDEAVAQLKRALAIQPDNAMVHNNLGSVLRQQGQLEQAIAHFQKAVLLQPHYANGHYNLGNALWQKGEVDEAIRQYRLALEIEPAFAQARHNLTEALARRGKTLAPSPAGLQGGGQPDQ